MTAAKNKYLIILFGLATLVLAVGAFSFLVPLRGFICIRSDITGRMACEPYPIAVVMLWNAIKALNDFAAAIVALAAVVITWFAFSLNRSTDALRQATEKLWSVSKDQVEIAARALTELERPWLFVDVSPWIHANSPYFGVPHVLFTVANHGRAAALVHSMDASFSTGFRPSVRRHEYEDYTGTTLAAGGEWKDCVAVVDDEIRRRLQEHGEHMIPEFDDENLFFTVRIEYTDAPGNPHVSRFGWRFDMAKERWIGLQDPDWFFAD